MIFLLSSITVQNNYRRIDDCEPVGGRLLAVVAVADERHVQRSRFDLVHVHPVEQDPAQRCGRRHRALDQPEHVGAPERQVTERPVCWPEAVENQLADVLDGQALQCREQAGRVVEQFHVTHRDAGQRRRARQPGRRQRHEAATGQRQIPDGRQDRGVLFPDDQQLWIKRTIAINTSSLISPFVGKTRLDTLVVIITFHRLHGYNKLGYGNRDRKR